MRDYGKGNKVGLLRNRNTGNGTEGKRKRVSYEVCGEWVGR